VLAQVISTGATAHFSREQEKEADDLGVKLMHGAGYDPSGMANMFRTLLAEQKARPNGVQRFFATHPLTEDRIKDVEAQAAKLPKKTNLLTDEPEFHTVRERLQ
jgi:predicted Zn-dependent protease